MKITLYQNVSEPERVTKTLKNPIVLTGTLREMTSVRTPSINVHANGQNLTKYNYVKIDEFGRYYYITDIESVNNGVWRLSLRCDVLMTYADTIKKQSGIIARQQNKWNLYLPDPEFVVSQKMQVQTKQFPKAFDGKTHYVLLLCGKNVEEEPADETT